MSTLKYYFYCF